MKIYLPSTNFGGIEGIIYVVDEYFVNQEEVFYFEGISKLEQRWRKCIEAKGDILRNNGISSALGKEWSSVAKMSCTLRHRGV